MYRTAADRKAEAARYRQLTEQSQQIPTVSLHLCEYRKDRKVLALASEYMGMPREFFVVSHKTGKEFRFVAVDKYDVLFDQDQWDGEQQIYRPVGHCPTVDHAVIYHAY